MHHGKWLKLCASADTTTGLFPLFTRYPGTYLQHYSLISMRHIFQLQLLQNSAAWMQTKTRERAHITDFTLSVWLPVCFRIDFKILLLVYKALNGLAPPYLPNLYLMVKGLQEVRQHFITILHFLFWHEESYFLQNISQVLPGYVNLWAQLYAMLHP